MMKYTDEEREQINHNYQIAVRNMNDRAWSAMLDSEKIANLQDIENKLAMDAGRIPSEVVTTKELAGEYGAQDGNTLLIDAQSLKKDDFREVLDTLYHEDAHARDWVDSVFSDRQAALSPEALHAIEHLAATYLRNHPVWAPKVVYWGPMGCCTGNYLIMQGELEPSDILPLLRETMEFVAGFDGEVPGATPRDCGNWSFMNLGDARKAARTYLDEVLASPAPENLNYPAE